MGHPALPQFAPKRYSRNGPRLDGFERSKMISPSLRAAHEVLKQRKVI